LLEPHHQRDDHNPGGRRRDKGRRQLRRPTNRPNDRRRGRQRHQDRGGWTGLGRSDAEQSRANDPTDDDGRFGVGNQPPNNGVGDQRNKHHFTSRVHEANQQQTNNSRNG